MHLDADTYRLQKCFAVKEVLLTIGSFYICAFVAFQCTDILLDLENQESIEVILGNFSKSLV